jgi:5'-3' exonuclease
MGIKNLNMLLREKCSKQSISKQDLRYIENKTIVVDTSIYLYRFTSENALMDNMYLLISILLSFNITPIFVFDGKPPPEKQKLLARRRMEKREAEQKYNCIQSNLSTMGLNDDDKNELILEMEQLRQQFIRITECDIQKVKGLMKAYGVSYYDAPGEADEVCAYMVKNGLAWACLSDDMDMFLYGCPIVLRNISLIHKTILVYDTSAILCDLNISESLFRGIMVLAGTDYNLNTDIGVYKANEMFHEYIESNIYKTSEDLTLNGFYEWVYTNINNTINLNDLYHINRMFNMNNMNNINCMNDIKYLPLQTQNIQKKQICSIMEKEGFVFTEKV